MIIVLFGLSGAGKNYIGRVLHEQYGFYFRDGDDDLPPEMRTAIERKEIVTDGMRLQHASNIVERLRLLGQSYPKVALAAGLFKEKHRQYIADHLPDVQFILVTAGPDVIQERLSRRHNHLSDIAYAVKIHAQFEPPQLPHAVIVNDVDGATDVIRQLDRLLNIIMNI
jgi:gluconokinase